MKKQKTRAGEPVLRSRLPTDVYVKKAADQGRCYYGMIPESEAFRLADAGVWLSSPVEADVKFGRDEQGRPFVEVSVRAAGCMECQRCLAEMSVELESHNTVVIVENWDELAATPSDDDVVVAKDDRLDIAEVVIDELLVQIPFSPRHAEESGECRKSHSLPHTDSRLFPGVSNKETGVKSTVDQSEVIQPFADLAALIAAKVVDKEHR